MKGLTLLLRSPAVCLLIVTASVSAQTKFSTVVLTDANGSVSLIPPSAPGSGSRTFEFPTTAPTGSRFILSETTAGQTIAGPLTLEGDLTFGSNATLTFGGSTGSAGDVLTSDGSGSYSWEAPSGGAGGGVPTTRTLTTTSPLTIGGGASADLSADRTIAFDFSIPNNWTGVQTLPASEDQGNALITSINAATTAIGVAQGGTGHTTFTDGQLLIGNSSGNTLTKAALTGSSGISISNGSGSITIEGAPLVFIGKTSSGMTTSSGPFYYHPVSLTTGNNAINAKVVSQLRVPRTGTLQNLYVDLSSQPGSGKTRTFHVMNAATTQSISAVITGTVTTGNSGSSTLSVSEGDYIVIKQAATSSPTDSQAAWSFELQ